MKIEDMVRFTIDDPEEMYAFFRYAKEHGILWTDGHGGDCGLVAFVSPKDRNKLNEFIVYYQNTKVQHENSH